MSEKRKPISKFIRSSWVSMNIRAGKYKHLQTEYQKHANECYKDISIEFTREEYKEWCLNQESYILSLSRPSVDRLDSSKNYSLDNIQIIELSDNISKKKYGNRWKNKVRGVRKVRNKWYARITFNYKERHIGSYNTEEEAQTAFNEEFFKLYGKYPY